MSKPETYIIIYLKETDGEPVIERLTFDEIKKLTKNMHPSDYAVIDGVVLKSFNQSHG